MTLKYQKYHAEARRPLKNLTIYLITNTRLCAPSTDFIQKGFKPSVYRMKIEEQEPRPRPTEWGEMIPAAAKAMVANQHIEVLQRA